MFPTDPIEPTEELGADPMLDVMPEDEEPKKPPISAMLEGMAPESINLADGLSDDERKKIAEETIRAFDRDWDSLSERRAKLDQILRLYLGMMPPSEDGQVRAQIHYPIIATAVQRMQARTYDQQFPSNGEYWGVKPTDAADLERSIRVAKHMNWQTEHQMPEYVPNHDVLIQQWYLYGSAFSYMYWDPVKDRPCHEACRTEDIVISYTERSTDPSMSDVARITRVLRKYRHELFQLADSGYYSSIDSIYEENDGKTTEKVGVGNDDKTDNPIQQTIDRQSGADKPEEDDPDAPRKLIEQHCWRKLPGDDREKPVIVTVDLGSRTLLCLKVREDEDPEDRARFNREKQAAQAQYQMAMQQYQMDMALYMQGVQQIAMQQTMTVPPMPGEQTMTAPPAPGMTTSTGPEMDLPVPPQEPEPPKDPRPPKMVPINFFTHFICIPNPEGFYGLGIGFLLEGMNIVADTIASQMVDAGTLSNTKTFIFSRQNKLSRGEFKIQPGQGIESDLPPQDLKNGIHILDFPPPDPGMAQFIRDQKEEAEALSGANEILSGEVGGSNETATTTQIRISQALAAIGIQNKRYTRARTVEGRKLARLNSVHLQDVEYFAVVDPINKMAPPSTEQIGRMDYLEDVDITVTADPRMASQPQRFQEATKAAEITMQFPQAAMNPVLMNAILKNIYVAMDRPDLVAALTMAPPMPMMPPGGPQGGPPQEGGKGGPPQPEDPGQAVPNAGATPGNAPFMGQAQ